jgi:hypothetical protein
MLSIKKNKNRMENKQNKYKQLSISDVKSLKKFTSISDNDATKIIKCINEIAFIIYHQQKKQSIEFTENEYLQAA